MLDPNNLKDEFKGLHYLARGFRQVKPITCASGLSFSAQASSTHYCTPRNSTGPWVAVEIGFPSQRVEELLEYAENPNDPTDTVYGYVPVELVEKIVMNHGGLAQPCSV